MGHYLMLKYNEPFSQRNYAQFHSFLLNFHLQKHKCMKKLLLSLAALFAATTAFAQGQSTIYSWDFNNGMPSGWSQVTNATDGGFQAGSASSVSSQYFTISDPGSNILATNDDDCNCKKLTNTLSLIRSI